MRQLLCEPAPPCGASAVVPRSSAADFRVPGTEEAEKGVGEARGTEEAEKGFGWVLGPRCRGWSQDGKGGTHEVRPVPAEANRLRPQDDELANLEASMMM